MESGNDKMTKMRRPFVIGLVSTMLAACCSGQALVASATSAGQSLDLPASIVGSGLSTGASDLAQRASSTQQAAELPDAPSAVQATLSFDATQPVFGTGSYEGTPAENQRTYDQTLGPCGPGKLLRMISGIARRFDEADVAAVPSSRGNAGLDGDTSFAVSRRLALIGAYQHNSFPSFDTMAFGVAFNLDGNTNRPSSQ